MESQFRLEITQHMVDIGMIDESQHGSTRGRSTLSQLIDQQNQILEMIDSGSNAELIYLDFSKAYDKISHSILLLKLEKMGVTGLNLEWIRHWLTYIHQRVRVSNSLSEWVYVESGIPQGSVLGPLLFLIYIWDLNLHDLKNPKVQARIYKYVDDSKVLTKVNCHDDIVHTQEILEHVYKWQVRNRMTWNDSKFVRVSFGNN